MIISVEIRIITLLLTTVRQAGAWTKIFPSTVICVHRWMDQRRLKIRQSILPFSGQFPAKHLMLKAMHLVVPGEAIHQPFITTCLPATRRAIHLSGCRAHSIFDTMWYSTGAIDQSMVVLGSDLDVSDNISFRAADRCSMHSEETRRVKMSEW